MEVDRSKMSGKCFKCGEAGHWARKCPKAMKGAAQFVRSLQPVDLCLVASAIGALPEDAFRGKDSEDTDFDDHFLFAGQ